MTAERIAEHHVGRQDGAAYTFDPSQLPLDAGQLPTGIDLRLLIALPVVIRNDQGESDGQA